MTGDHGYARYANPRTACRCEVCRRAKADYMREKRAAARAKAQPGVKVPGVLHGSRVTYEEQGCRCRLCVEAKRIQWRVEGWARTERARAERFGGAA